MTNVKKVILMMLVVLLLGVSITTVFATDEPIIVEPNTVEGNTQNTANTANTTNTANTANNNTSIIGNTTNNTSSYNNTTTLPQTGAGDYMMILIIGVFAVSAVYAYKKVRDYKNV